MTRMMACFGSISPSSVTTRICSNVAIMAAANTMKLEQRCTFGAIFKISGVLPRGLGDERMQPRSKPADEGGNGWVGISDMHSI